jgi:hypothetical protein
MGDTPPNVRSPLRRRWRWHTPKLHADPRVLAGIGLCSLAFVTAVSPQRQSLEGALRVNGLSFVLKAPEGDSETASRGFLVVPLRSLTIKELDGGNGLVVPLSGKGLALGGNKSLSLHASWAEPMWLRIALPVGTRIETIQIEGKDEVVLDLLPPPSSDRAGLPAELVIIPPTRAGTAIGPATTALQAVYAVPGRQKERIKTPETEFPLPLTGGTRLRLQRADPSRPLVFERNLRVRDVRFISQTKSLFDQLPVTTSTLQSGTLRLGRQEPLTLQTDQFLQIDPPGIDIITSMRITPEAERKDSKKPPDLLAVEVIGESTKIRSGLSLDHPTTEVQGTLLSRHLSPDQMSSLFGFLAGVLSSLVLTCFHWE